MVLRKLTLPILVLIVAAILLPGTSSAALYTYVDEIGVQHFTNAPTNSRYRMVERSTFSPLLSQFITRYDEDIRTVSKQYEIDPALVRSIIRVESGFNPLAISVKGAQGLMQLMPATAQDLRVANPFHPRENIIGGVKYLRYLLNLFKGDVALALAAYNAGENAVLRYGSIPPYPETMVYVQKVLGLYDPSLESQLVSIPRKAGKSSTATGSGRSSPPDYRNKIYKKYRDIEGERIVIYTNIPAPHRPGMDQ
jgi:soluble lytic murein transglycosylase-like protein